MLPRIIANSRGEKTYRMVMCHSQSISCGMTTKIVSMFHFRH